MNQLLHLSRRYSALFALLLCVAPVAASAQGFKWWQSEKFQQELHLTPEQIATIEDTFQSSLPEFREQKRTLDRLEGDLSKLIDASADEAAVMQQADRVEEVRSALAKARTRMLVRIRKVLTPEQRVKLATLHQEWERNRKKQDRRR